MSEYSNYRKPPSQSNSYYSSRDYFKDNLRVLKRNLLFCSGLPLSLSEEELKTHQYFGKYGTVLKVTLLRNIRQMSVYVTYSDPFQASLAIIATNDFDLDRYHKLASIYGTIKYCKYFLKKIECKNLPHCNYLHVYDKKNQIYINNQLPDQVFDQHYSIAMGLLKQVDIQRMIKEKRLIENSPKNNDILPCPIQTLKRIAKEREIYQVDDRDESSCSSVQGSQNSYSDEQDQGSIKSHQKSQKSSEQQTYETIASQSQQQLQQNNQHEDFPKIQTLIQSDKKQKAQQKQKMPQKKYKQKQQLFKPQEKDQNQMRHYRRLQDSNQSLQIKVIRKILREPRSKLTQWTDASQPVKSQDEVNFFHKELDQLNELRQLCESNILKEQNQQEQRVKFFLIKNIHRTHHRKHHHGCNHHSHHHNAHSNKDAQKHENSQIQHHKRIK